MKEFAMRSLLVVSSTLAMVGMTQVNAATSTIGQQMQQQSHWEHRGKHNRGSMKRAAFSKLNLTDAQKTQIAAIKKAQRDAHRDERKTNQAQRKQQRAKMQALINSPSLNTSDLNTLANEHSAKAKERFVERVQTQRAIAQILTTEQRAKLKQMHNERSERSMGTWIRNN